MQQFCPSQPPWQDQSARVYCTSSLCHLLSLHQGVCHSVVANLSELSFSQQPTSSESRATVISTPRIDAVLDRFHKALDKSQVVCSGEEDVTPVPADKMLDTRQVDTALQSGCSEEHTRPYDEVNY